MAYNQGKNPFSKNPLNFNSPLNSFDSLVGKLMNQGKSKEAATKIAGKVANAKMKGAGSGPTAAQKARAKGSAAKMEDLSGDGKITKKDVLIGRGVIEKDGSPAKAHDKKLKALEERIKRVRESKEGSEGQGGIDYELLAQLQNQKKQLIESHGKKAKETAKPSPANHAGHPGGDPTKDAEGNKLKSPPPTTAVSSVKPEGIKEVKGEDSKLELKESAKKLTQADLDANKSTAKSKGIVSSEGRDGTNRQERKKRRQERKSIRKRARSKGEDRLSQSQKRMALKESRQQQKDNVRGVKKESPVKFHEPKDAAHGNRVSHRSGETRREIAAKQQARAKGTQQGKSPAKMKKKPGGKRNPLTSSPMGDISGDKVYGPATAAISAGKKVIKGGKKLIKGAAKFGKKVVKGLKKNQELAQTGGPYKKKNKK